MVFLFKILFPMQYHAQCSEFFCYLCIKETLNDILLEVERLCNNVDVQSSLNVDVANKSSLPNHRRSRSDDVFSSFGVVRRNKEQSLTNNHERIKPKHRFGDFSSTRTFTDDSESIFKSIQETKALKSFILARQYDENAIELEKENAHFVLSEILIGAIEQMKWRNVMSSQIYGKESSVNKKQIYESQDLTFVRSSELTPNSIQNPLESRPSTSSSSADNSEFATSYESNKENSNAYVEVTDPLFEIKDSAEAIASELLEHFSRNHISPAIMNLHLPENYIVSFEEAPQKLLPIPDYIAVSSDDTVSPSKAHQLRGTSDWAPPRQQVIFNIHKPQKLKTLLISQKNRCPGCGRYVEARYYKRLRYCSYFGKAFCQCCHKGDTSTIPALIVHKWDFKKHPVSDIAWNFLQHSYDLPLYDIFVLNVNLYNRVKLLRQLLRLRLKLGFARDFVVTCHLADKIVTKDGILRKMFDDFSSHIFTDPHLYSVKDFVETQNGILIKKLDSLLVYATVHIETCQSCAARGFYCELCGDNKSVIFPCQSDSLVQRCVFCGSCFHKRCVRKNIQCPKCERMRIRKEMMIDSYDDD